VHFDSSAAILGTLAKAVTEAGGLGIIGFGYGNQERIDQEFRAAGNRLTGE
jgi:nitronate monooxygenase